MSPADSPLDQASTDHLDDCRYRHLSPKTIALYHEYEQSFLDYLRDQGLALALSSLNATNVKACSSMIRTRHGGKRNGEYAARATISTLKTWSVWLCEQDQLPLDPLARLRLPKVTRVARQPLELHEVQAIRGALADSQTGVRDIAAFSLLLATGLRIGELVSLSVGDVDMQAYTLKVHGKGRRERILRFGDGSRTGGKVVQRLRDYLRTRRPGRPEHFFLSYDGHPLGAEGFRGAYVKACRRAGVRNTEVHRTRHTMATNFLLRHPGDIEGLRYLLGHLSDDMYRVYSGQAGRLLAELNGDEVGAAAMMDVPRLASKPERATTDSVQVDQLLDTIQRDPQLRRALLKALLGADESLGGAA